MRASTSRHLGIAALATANTVAAVGGAWGLASGVLGLGGLEGRLPWGSVTVAGAALFVCVAVPNAALAVLAWRGDRRTGPAAVLTGALLVGWIVVELAFLREVSFFHPLYAGVGLLLVVLGRRAARPGWRARRGSTLHRPATPPAGLSRAPADRRHGAG